MSTNAPATPASAADETFAYPQVQAILRTAAGNSPVDYGGLGPFWDLPLGEFLDARLMGLPLIEPVPSCCGSGEARPGRGARSTLVKGLRGESPFDRTQFVPLMWGGAAVGPADIDRIEAWIDEGCPGAPLATVETKFVAEEFERVEVKGLAGPVFPATADPGAYRYQKGELRQRMDIDAMSDDQLERLRCAFRETYALNKWPQDIRSYNNVALIHQNHCQHGWERFLPWHRIYLYEFEQVLQDMCPDVTMPYWNFATEAYYPGPAFPPKGPIIPEAYKAYLTPSSLPMLAAAGIPTGPLEEMASQQKHYTTPRDFFDAVGAAIGKQYTQNEHRNRFIDALLEANALWYPLRYSGQFGGSAITDPPFHYHYPSATDMQEIMSLRTFRDFGGGSLYDDSFGFMDQNPHNSMHIWTGGLNPDFVAPKSSPTPADRNRSVRITGRNPHHRADLYTQPPTGDMLSNLTASYDPIFWPIHANVDRLWWNWQQVNPQALPADLDAVLTPWSYAIRDTLDMHRFGYEYVQASVVVPVGLTNPVGRFVSAPIPVPDATHKGFRTAEVRLHRVPQLPRSCFIRVFLNVDQADASTPLSDPGYAGYAAVFGHGECYGGPGHCDLPDEQGRKFDRRPRSMNTPRNHRIDVTRAVRRLLADGAQTIQITLVVIGASYEEDKELLRLDGVSLNFLD